MELSGYGEKKNIKMNVETKTILVFGSQELLGRYVVSYLKRTLLNVVPLTRNDLNIRELIEPYKHKQPVIVNCAETIPQRTNTRDIRSYIESNARFPLMLSEICSEIGCPCIHISTDCVFSGESVSSYDETNCPDETGIYGLSKSLGEHKEACVIRTSIIGEENKSNGQKSLLEWIKHNDQKSIQGYANHTWNGITCLQLARIIHTIIQHSLYWKGVRHLYSPEVISKYELIGLIAQRWGLTVDIQKTNSSKAVNRSLSTLYPEFLRIFRIPSLAQQLRELKTYRYCCVE